MNEFTSIIVSFGITIGFIITIQLQKKIFKQVEFLTDFLMITLFTLTYATFLLCLFKYAASYNYVLPIVYNFLYDFTFKRFLITMLKAFLLNSILYLGYIAQLIYRIEYISSKPFIRIIKDNIYGPFIEEIIYRGIIFNLLVSSGNNEFFSAILSSLLFGIYYLTNNTPIEEVLNSILFQCTFTSVFGLYTTYTYIYSKCIFSSILLHSYCNYIGLPKFQYFKYSFLSQNLRNVFSVLYFLGIITFFVYFSRIMEFEDN